MLGARYKSENKTEEVPALSLLSHSFFFLFFFGHTLCLVGPEIEPAPLDVKALES